MARPAATPGTDVVSRRRVRGTLPCVRGDTPRARLGRASRAPRPEARPSSYRDSGDRRVHRGNTAHRAAGGGAGSRAGLQTVLTLSQRRRRRLRVVPRRRLADLRQEPAERRADGSATSPTAAGARSSPPTAVSCTSPATTAARSVTTSTASMSTAVRWSTCSPTRPTSPRCRTPISRPTARSWP